MGTKTRMETTSTPAQMIVPSPPERRENGGFLRPKGSSRTFADSSSNASFHLSSGSTNEEAGLSSTLSRSAFFPIRQSLDVPLPKTAIQKQRPDIDLAKLRFEQDKLYGRDKETAALLKACTIPCNAIKENDIPRRPVVFISGFSGVGKTALAAKLQSHTRQKGGIYALGKYDFQEQSLPYPGITQACRHICAQLRPSDDQKRQLREELGSSIYVLSGLLPTLLDLAGLETDETHNNPRIDEAQNRFLYSIGAFLRTVASWRPLVMVLDDLQWADVGSYTLLESLTKESPANLKNFVLVGCYRSNEVDGEHSVSLWIRDMEFSSQNCITHIRLVDLTVEAVQEMVADVLRIDADQTTDLASVVHTKTLGNSFFVKQYLKMLQDKNLLGFNIGSMKWTWDTNAIKIETEVSDNVVDLMKQRMSHLPCKLSVILPLAACLGSTFTTRTLSVVLDNFPEDCGYVNAQRKEVRLDRWLEACVYEGLIAEVVAQTYSWVHDRIREAALTLIDPEQLENMQFCVGEVLLDHLTEPERKFNVFVITNLLNCGLTDNSKVRANAIAVLEITQMNLNAGRTAMAAASFGQASKYLRTGISCLPGNPWEREPELTLELYSAAAEAEFCTGNTQNMERLCHEIIRQNHLSASEKFRAYNVLVTSVGNRNQMERACTLACKSLAELGCTFPRYGQRLAVLHGMVRMKYSLNMFGPSDFESHKLLHDKQRIQAMKMLDRLITFAYPSGTFLFPLSILKSFRWSIKYGISEFSPPVFTSVGFVLCAKLGDFQGGRIYAEYALALLERGPEFEVVKSRTIFLSYVSVLHSCMILRRCLPSLLSGYKAGRATGDVESAHWCILFYLDFSWYMGQTLKDLDEDWSLYTKEMETLSQLRQCTVAKQSWQAARNLMGLSDDPYVLKGDIFDIDAFEAGKPDKNLIVCCRFRQIDLAFFMGDDRTGAEIAHKLHRDFTVVDLNPATSAFDMMKVRSGILCYGSARKRNSRKYLLLARKCHKYIKKLGRRGNPNFLHLEQLLEAELAALRGRKLAAKKHFETAFVLSARMGNVNDQAFCNERFADYMFEIGNHDEAEYRYKKAVQLYREWGAVVKVDQLTRQLSSLQGATQV